ncbi:ribosomal protein L5 domain-containing protein [Abortiporus biennis]|nr:ribosomal protein L5 domain-containing protein [Abortiporus biennis]
MSAVTAARSATQTAKRVRKPLKHLRRDKNGVPIPHVNIIVRDTQPCRLSDHYYNTVRDDIMYMTYVHEPNPRKPPRQYRALYDAEDPYAKHRYNPPAGGSHWTRTLPPVTTAENVVQLEKIQLHTFVKQSLANRSNLLPAIMAFRAISGESEHQGGRRTTEGVQLVEGRSAIGGWIRPGMPCGVTVDLKGPKMYDFLGTLVEFVLPRMREFTGLVLPAPSATPYSPHAASGVVSFGLPPHYAPLFPQIEVNQDAYPKIHGFHIHFITNAKGVGAQDQARKLLSGFQIPFIRK